MEIWIALGCVVAFFIILFIVFLISLAGAYLIKVVMDMLHK